MRFRQPDMSDEDMSMYAVRLCLKALMGHGRGAMGIVPMWHW